MKSAYELAMEKLKAQGTADPALTDEQRQQLADIEANFTAKIAEQEILLKPKIAEAELSGNLDQADQLRNQLRTEIQRLQGKREEEKERVRSTAG